ncbi:MULTISPECIES: response regulator [unclassified Streptomyces]|uniref:Response regulator transcription factor n=1 Tax=Streptomyces sp. NBC_00060 TaxID=2975636 RepID=A0AAU2GUP6_9ACTN
MIRVLLADDDALVRQALHAMLESHDDLHVVGEARDGQEAITMARRLHPDVVLMDIRMPHLDGLAATCEITKHAGCPSVLMLTTFDVTEYIDQALTSGADGFLLKDAPPLEVAQAIRDVAQGKAVLSNDITLQIVHLVRDRSRAFLGIDRDLLPSLTNRERDILPLIAQGRSNAEIGHRLHVSEATVKAHVSRLLIKLDVGNRVQLAILAHRAGLAGE